MTGFVFKFASMKFKFLKILFLLVGFTYIASACEFDHKEMKQNYEKETHTYITCTKSADDFNFHVSQIIIQHFIFSEINFQCENLSQIIFFSFLKEPSPPDKIFLRQHSLLI